MLTQHLLYYSELVLQIKVVLKTIIVGLGENLVSEVPALQT